MVVDSDVEFVRPFTAETFVRDGRVRFFCKRNEIGRRFSRHMTWHRVARELLGLPPAEPPYPDYISPSIAWDPAIVRRMLAQVAATTDRPPLTAIAGQLDFSECVLHGVFVDEVMGAQANSFVSDDPLCRAYWGPAPLNVDSAAHFIRAVQPTDIAVAISSKSRTPLAVREEIFSTLRATGPWLQVRKVNESSARECSRTGLVKMKSGAE